MCSIEDDLPLQVRRALLKAARRLIAEAEWAAGKKGVASRRRHSGSATTSSIERGMKLTVITSDSMFEKCPHCGEMSGEIQAPDEFAGIEAARLGTLRARCAICDHEWILPIEIQAAWAAVL